MRQAAELHDVGKVAVPDAILEKRGPLDDEEWRFIRQHTVTGERIIGAAPALARSPSSSAPRTSAGTAPAIPTARGDRHPGRLPDRQRLRRPGPRWSRIARIAEAVGLPAALEELARCAGTQFDPDVVAALTAVLTAPAAVAA